MNILSLINQYLDNYYQIKSKILQYNTVSLRAQGRFGHFAYGISTGPRAIWSFRVRHSIKYEKMLLARGSVECNDVGLGYVINIHPIPFVKR
jgi:hypothetical protein